ncbi:protein FAR1-RELATED SEQUENCE 5-like [Arachis duranensis]|uniref:Protein FAR1-RELATED SEQUENCE 5-like n=1 Tax=Arachis duranensis TaxID=130453 RepID=A0A9C6THD2_ARADU|nr:protein FAR1-RELATED SEQUENCE 5-like [Arachis duranensis]
MNIDDNKNLKESIECNELCFGYDNSSDKEEEDLITNEGKFSESMEMSNYSYKIQEVEKKLNELSYDDMWGIEFDNVDQCCDFYRNYAEVHDFVARLDEKGQDFSGNLNMRQMNLSYNGVYGGTKRRSKQDGSHKKDLYNHFDRSRRAKIKDGDAHAALSYLISKADEDSLLQGKFTLKDGKLDNLVSADGSSITDYQCFGDVLTFDATYQKNKYNRPLVVFSRTNHHGQTCIFGCGLLSDEKRETYVLVLNTFIEIIGNKQPIAVVTDGDLAMREAIKEVLLNAAHRLCTWHLYRNACEAIKNSKFLDGLKHLMYENFFPEEFERRWHNLISEYELSENEWLQKTYRIKEMWAFSYLNDKFFGGIRTTSQCEGSHSLIKNYISKKCYLLELIHNFNEALTQYRTNELLSDFKSLFTTPVLTTCLQDIEKQAADIFTRSMFKEVRCEIEEAGKLNVVTHSVSNNEVKVRINKYRQPGRECEVQYDKVTKKFACDCRLFESRGIRCCHIFCTMRHDHIDIIPDTLVCTRWTKNTKKDCVCSVTSAETDSENIAGIRYGALVTLCFTLCESASKNRDDFMEIRDDIFGLIQKLKKRRDPDSNVLSNACMVGDPTVVKTKGVLRQNRWAIKSRKCSHCIRRGHTIRRCPELYSRDVLHTGHHQSSDELNDEKSYFEEEINYQSNDESNV